MSDKHEPFTDDGVTYCGWDGHEGCGELWPCSTARGRSTDTSEGQNAAQEREQRYAEAINGEWWSGASDYQERAVRAVIAVADAEMAEVRGAIARVEVVRDGMQARAEWALDRREATEPTGKNAKALRCMDTAEARALKQSVDALNDALRGTSDG